MVHINKVMNAFAKYVDNDLVPKLEGWQKWVFGAGAGLLMSGLPSKIDELRKQPIISYMGVIDDRGMVDVERLFNELMKQARKSSITVDLSKIMLPPLTVDHTDVEKIYRYIQEG